MINKIDCNFNNFNLSIDNMCHLIIKILNCMKYKKCLNFYMFYT